ncbi:HlyD family type I secretion periplasmic adaptor subunit [Zavarzinia sp. CC-PAN008]|uniref:HlyD family type I secretion periplasmic adaptor subunit n=1 Tax=Zavarzinia sp. CC-PAN008 TaxID=3243332 RepID=UPI003F743475
MATLARLWPFARQRSPEDRAWEDDQPPDLEDILAERPPVVLRRLHYVVVALLVALIAAASVLQVDMIVSAQGRLATDRPTIVIQPIQLSIVRDLNVKPGDAVRRGDVLATLDPTFSEADRATLTTQQEALLAQIARLEAEAAERDFTLTSNAPDALLQRDLFERRRSQYAQRLAAFDQEIAQLKADSRTTEGDRTSLTRQLAIAKEVETMRAGLYQREVGSKINYLDAQVARMATERDMQKATNRLSEIEHAIAAKQAERQGFIDDWRRQVLEALVAARASASAVGENLAKAARIHDLVVLTAPEDGVVLEVAQRSAGSVLKEGEPLVTMVPGSAGLMADVMLASGDVGYARTGDTVEIKVDAFPFQRHGLLHGRVSTIGEESLSPAQTAAPGNFHRSRIAIDDTTLRDLPPGTRLIPGMTLTAEIKVGSRSVISYFLYPVTRGFREAIREP